MNAAVRCCLGLALAMLGLAGCSQYSSLPVNEEPVGVALLPVVNRSELPQIIAPLSRNIRERIATSPNWNLVDEADAEAVLLVTILPVESRAMARDPLDTGKPLSFHEEIRVSIEWISALPAPWGPDPVTVVTDDQVLYAQPRRVDSRTSAMPALADRLSNKVIQALDWEGPAIRN